MFMSPFKSLLLGSTIAATSTFFAAAAFAQSTLVETPQGNAVVVPDAALETSPSAGFVAETDYPRLESIENNETIAETLIAQGYSDVVIRREGPILTVTAQRAGVPIELVYSTANGRLISVDGVETRAAPEASSGSDLAPAATGSSSNPAAADDAASPDEGVSDEAEADAGTDDATAETPDSSEGADEGAETDGADDAGSSGADSGANGDSGADSGSGSDADSDGGADNGADSDSGAEGSDSTG
ncbi:MAG: hypothetical protein FJX25_16650 [Alphaproteobacteria bacterium]|nr:hypothetical protein [Alphaproteobacteria bacterium]